jgi:predicted GIY-YIG superfamily endonuclease
MFRPRLRSRLAEMGESPDYRVLAAEVLGIRAPNVAIARRLVEQALVVEDWQQIWNRLGERVQPELPSTPGVYVMRDHEGRVIYVGKAKNLKRRVSTYFAAKRWRALTPELPSATDVEWHAVGSELEALLLEAELIERWLPTANTQTRAPRRALKERPARVRDVILLLASTDADSVELFCARTDGALLHVRIARSGPEIGKQSRRIFRFFHGFSDSDEHLSPRAAIVFAWLARSGDEATRMDPRDVTSPRELGARLRALVADPDLFVQRIDQRGTRGAATCARMGR